MNAKALPDVPARSREVPVMVESGKVETCDAKVQGSIPQGVNVFLRYIDIDR
jgi:hypothetical protein